jgi:hypothetical protein
MKQLFLFLALALSVSLVGCSTSIAPEKEDNTPAPFSADPNGNKPVIPGRP